jgi:hypothetical protein
MAVFGNSRRSTRDALAAPAASVSNWTVDDIRKSDILVFRKSANEYIDTVVAPNGFQVGLLDEAFLTDLLVTGHITGSGVICAVAGFSGSLQKLVDGTDYLRGGTGISVSNHEDGYITITNTGGGGGSAYTAGTALTLAGSQFNVDYDNTTVGVNSSSKLEVKKTPGTLTAGNGLNSNTFDGSVAKTLSVKTVSGSPLTVSSAGVGMNISTISAISLSASDELIVQQGSSVGKSTVQDILDLVPSPSAGANTTEAYLVATASSGLSNERVLTGGNGIGVVDSPGTTSFTVAVEIESGGGLKFVTGKLAVKLADFAGFGLSESGGDLIVNSSAIAGTGLTTSGQQLAVDFASVAAATNTITVAGGLGINASGIATLGTAASTINLEVQPSDFKGRGLNVSNSKLDLWVEGLGGITIGTGSIDTSIITIDGTGLGNITSLTAGSGLTGGGTTGALTLDVSDITVPLFAANSITKSNESFIDNDTSVMTSAAINDLIESKGYTTQAGDITSIIAGSGLATGGTSGDVTIDVDYGGSDSIVMSANNGTTIEIEPENDYVLLHDGSDSTVKYVKASQIGAVMSGMIGTPEDGSYTDGLFNDFTSSTAVGTAVDRFNEILKSLVPSSSPNLSTIGENIVNGADVNLSFGVSNNIAGYTNVSLLDGVGAKDVNASYQYGASNSNLVLGVFDKTVAISGDVNSHVTADENGNITNYPDASFTDGDKGNLILELNGSTVYTLDLSSNSTGAGVAGSGTGSHLSSNTGFYDVSIATSGKFSSGTSFDTYKHRTAKYKIDASIQLDGWNYAKVKHVIPPTTRVTTHVQWINDSEGASSWEEITISGESLNNLSMSGMKYLSGVKYYTGGTVIYDAAVSKLYTNVYGTTPITFQSAELTGAPVSIDQIDLASNETENKSLIISETLTITSNSLLNAPVSAGINITHPIKTNISDGGSSTLSNVLLYSVAEASTSIMNTTENFAGESYRLISGAYNLQDDVSNSSNVYNSQTSLISNNGLLVWNQKLVAPIQGSNGGNFTAISNGPAGNVNYSTITSGSLEYYRKFVNDSGFSQSNFQLNIQGSGTIVGSTGTLSGDAFRVFVKMPSNESSSTGWLDITKSFETGQYADGDGCLIGTFDNTLNSIIIGTFGIKYVENSEMVVIKVVADATWTGHISSFSVTWG